MKWTSASLMIILLLNCSSPRRPDEMVSSVSSENADTAVHASTALTEPPRASQENNADSSGFNNFVQLFVSSGITPVTPIYAEAGYVLNRIPDSVVYKFIAADAPLFPGCGYFAKEKIDLDSAYLLFYVFYKAVGPGVDELHLNSYTLSGQLLSHVTLGESYSGESTQECSYEFNPSSKVLIVNQKGSERADDGQNDPKVITSEYFFKVDEIGFVHELPARQYPQTSNETLTEAALSSYTKEELKLMRNEVYAVHGYIFKNEVLRDYFSAMPWYVPTNENVDHLLTPLEKENIGLIKRLESRR